MRSVSEIDYFRESPRKAAFALVSSVLAGFIVGIAVHLFVMKFLSLEPYFSVGFSSPASIATTLYLNRVVRSLMMAFSINEAYKKGSG